MNLTDNAQKKVLTFNYTLKDSEGNLLDSSDDGPMSFLTGSGQILPALETELTGMLIGQKKNVSLKAKDAYGETDPKMVMQVERKELTHLELEVGTFLQLNLGETIKVVRVVQMDGETVTLDGNHPLAGIDLSFDIELVDQRPATKEEVAHGHAHGPGGAHHH